MQQNNYLLITSTFILHRKKTASMASGGPRWSCAPLPGRPERAGPALTRFHRERRRGLRREGVGGRSGVQPGDRPSSRISQRWSFCRIITRLTPPSRRTLSAQVRPTTSREANRERAEVTIAQCENSSATVITPRSICPDSFKIVNNHRSVYRVVLNRLRFTSILRAAQFRSIGSAVK